MCMPFVMWEFLFLCSISEGYLPFCTEGIEGFSQLSCFIMKIIACFLKAINGRWERWKLIVG